MRLGRKRERDAEPQLSSEDAGVIIRVYLEFESNIDRYRRLLDQREAGAAPAELRPEALAGARGIAFVSRVAFGLSEELHAGIPSHLSPDRALGAMRRLAYALVALGEENEDSDPALLTRDEVDGLVGEYELDDWLETCRRHLEQVGK